MPNPPISISVGDYVALPKELRPTANYKGETVTNIYRDPSYPDQERYVIVTGPFGAGSKKAETQLDLVPADQPPSADQIHLAHDLLESIVLGKLPTPDFTVPGDTNYLYIIKLMANTLCWVLGHTGNPMVAHELYAIDQWLRANGFAMIDAAGNPVPEFPEPPVEPLDLGA